MFPSLSQKRLLPIVLFLAAGSLTACMPKPPLILPTTPPSERNENPGADAPPVFDSDCEEAEDCFEEGLNRWKDGDRDNARLVMNDLRNRFPDSPWAGRASFIRGVWAAEIGSPFTDFYLKDVEDRIPVLGPYVLLSSARGHFNGGRYEEAGEALDRFFESHHGSVLAPEAAILRARAFISKGLCGKALRGLESLPALVKKKVPSPEILIFRADCAEMNMEYDEAARFLQEIWFHHSGSPQADIAQARLEDLQARGVSLPEASLDDRRKRAEWLLGAGRYRDAQVEFSMLAGIAPQEEGHALRILEGEALVRLREYDQAVELFEAVAVESEDPQEVREALFWLGRVAARRSQLEALYDVEHRLAENHPRSAQRARVIYYIADILEDRGDKDGARQAFESILVDFPSGRVAEDTAWRLGWLAYMDGEFDEAIWRFGHFVDRNPSDPESAQYLYWIGRSAEKAGRADEALRAFSRACSLKLRSYYCQRSSVRFARLPIFSFMPASLSPENRFSEPSLSRISLSFSLASQRINGFSLYPEESEPSVVSHPAFFVVSELIAMRMLPEARKELAQLGRHKRWDSESILFLSDLFDRIGDPYQSLRLVRLYYNDLIANGGSGVPERFWRLAFPSAQVLDTFEHYPVEGIDPYLASAVAREESAYNAAVVSRAGAIGLMQLMPYTAREVARDLGLGDVQAEDLKDPVLNIRLGSRYLRDLIDRFEGNWVLAVASYNAGPEAVSRWIVDAPSDLEEFIETIPYRETRNYTKRVIRSYLEYKRISNNPASLSPPVPPAFYP